MKEKKKRRVPNLLHDFSSSQGRTSTTFRSSFFYLSTSFAIFLLLPPCLDSSTFPIPFFPQALVSHFLFLPGASSLFVVFSRPVLVLAPSFV